MTELEKEAEEYALKNWEGQCPWGVIAKAYEAGAKEHLPQWHEVSEQLPNEEKDYLVKLTDGTVDVMAIALNGDLEPYTLNISVDFYRDVEKWCEIPEEE